MQTYTNYQNTTLLILRIITAAMFYVAAYYKFPFWSHPPEGTSPFMLFTTRLLSIVEPLGATAVLSRSEASWNSKPSTRNRPSLRRTVENPAGDRRTNASITKRTKPTRAPQKLISAPAASTRRTRSPTASRSQPSERKVVTGFC